MAKEIVMSQEVMKQLVRFAWDVKNNTPGGNRFLYQKFGSDSM